MSRQLLPVASGRATAQVAVGLLRAHPVALGLAIAAFVVAGLAGLVGPWVLGRIVDDVRRGAEMEDIWRSAALIAGSAVVGAVATIVSLTALARATEPALASLREDVLDRALHLDSARIEAAGTGDLVSRVGDDVKRVAQALSQLVPLVVTSLVAVVLTAGGLFTLDWRLGLAGFGAVPLFVLSLRWYLPRSGPFYRREREAIAERAESLVTGIQGARTLRDLGRDEVWLARINGHSRTATTIAIEVWRLLLRFFGRNNLAEFVGLLLVLVVGFLIVSDGSATVGAVTTAALLFHRLFNPIGAILVTFDEVQSAGASLARLAGVSLLGAPDRGAPPTAGEGAAALSISGVSHAYRADQWVLREVTLEVAPGERVAIVGATGAGKTTLGAIAAGSMSATQGTLLLDGADTSTLDERRIRRRVALVTQEVHVFAGTVRDNLTLAAAEATAAEVDGALAATGCSRWVAALPEGAETVVGDHGHALTAAQAQQLALARLLLQSPGLAVFDEATAEAGSSGARDLEAAAWAASEGRTSLVIAHRLTQARTADRVVVMDEGTVVEIGTHEELVAAGGRYAALWAAWSAD